MLSKVCNVSAAFLVRVLKLEDWFPTCGLWMCWGPKDYCKGPNNWHNIEGVLLLQPAACLFYHLLLFW